MEISANGKITLRFYRQDAQMSLSPTAAAYLKLPKCIKILEKDDFRKLIFCVCEMGEPDSFPIVGKNYSYRHGGIAIKSTTFVFKIWESNGWEKDARYIVNGIIDPDKPDIILFDLARAEKIEDKADTL